MNNVKPFREIDNRDMNFVSNYYFERIAALTRELKETRRQLAQREEAIGELVRTRGEL